MKKNFGKMLLSIFVAAVASLVLFACAKPNDVERTITFEVDGEVYATIVTVGNEVLNLPDNPRNHDYNFDGWYFDKDVWQEPFNAKTYAESFPTEDKRVYAKWKKNTRDFFIYLEEIGTTTIWGVKSKDVNLYEAVIPDDILFVAVGGEDEFEETQWYKDQPEGWLYIDNWLVGYKGTLPDNSTLNVREGTKGIGDSALDNCENLKNITIPDSLYIINRYGLTETAWFKDQPDGMVYLNDIFIGYKGDFANNATLTVRDGTKALASGCFETLGENGHDWQTGTYAKTFKVKLPEGLKFIADFSFGYSAMTEVNIPESVTEIGIGAFGEQSLLTSLTFPKNLKRLEYAVCSGDEKLKNVFLPENLEYIGCGAFSSCEIENIVIPDSVKEIDIGAFSGNIKLKNITIGASVEKIGVYAFQGCTAVVEVYNKSSLDIARGSSSYGGVARYARYVYSECFDEGEFSYRKYGDMYSLVSYNGTASEVVLPENVKGETYNIGVEAFKNHTEITKVTIPDSIGSVAGSAFSGCNNITTAVIPTTAIGSIPKNSLTEVTLTSGTSIGYRAFYGCSGLTSVTIPDSVTSIGSEAFSGCSGLTSITIPDGVTSIGSEAFSGCSGLTSVTIGNGVTSIGYYAFENTAWYNNQPDGLVYAGKVAYKYKGTMPENTTITLEEGTKGIAGSAFSGCSGLASITIPDSVTSIGDEAFRNCSGLTSITIPNSVTSIGYEAFRNCSGLTSITIPDSVTSIGNNAFYGCYRLVEIYNKSSLNFTKGSDGYGRIACYALNIYSEEGGSKLTNDNGFIIYDGNTVVNYVGNDTEITIPDSVTSIGSYAFYGCSGLTSITIPDSVTSIGNNAFSGCSGLTSITIPDSVTSIGNNAFYGCYRLVEIYNKSSLNLTKGSWGYGGIAKYALNIYTEEGGSKLTNENGFIIYDANTVVNYVGNDTEITIPNEITKINGYAFYNCHSLTAITIPDGVTSIGNYAFEGCSGLTSVTIGNSVTSIGNYAFYGCSGLTSITIPDSVTSIGGDAFFYCRELTDINYSGTKSQWQAIAKDSAWADNTGDFTVTCTDGVLTKSEALN